MTGDHIIIKIGGGGHDVVVGVGEGEGYFLKKDST